MLWKLYLYPNCLKRQNICYFKGLKLSQSDTSRLLNKLNTLKRYSFQTNHSSIRHRNQPMRILVVTGECFVKVREATFHIYYYYHHQNS